MTEEIGALCFWLIKLKGMKWVGPLVCTGELRSRARILENFPLLRRRCRWEGKLNWIQINW
jgi:hypothetical protein